MARVFDLLLKYTDSPPGSTKLDAATLAKTEKANDVSVGVAESYSTSQHRFPLALI